MSEFLIDLLYLCIFLGLSFVYVKQALQMFQQNGYKNVMDIACGFSSRGLYMARHGIHFVGAEFPAVAVYGNQYLAKCCLQKASGLRSSPDYSEAL